MRNLSGSVVCFVLGLMMLTYPRPAEAAVLLNALLPFAQTVNIDCDDDGTPEDVVDLSGFVHTLVTATTNGHITRLTIIGVPRGVTGTGLLSGDTYRGVGQTSQSVVTDTFLESTFVNTALLIGQPSGINYKVHVVSHLTINPQGDVTATVDNISITCVGA